MFKAELQILLRPGSRYIRLIAEAPEDKDEAEKREQEALRQKEEAIIKANESRIKLARQMKKYGSSNEEIVRETWLLEKDIEELD